VQLEHQFTVPAPVGEVWAAVIDPERVAPCMPGATIASVDGPQFTGGVKVKVGPISLQYKGSGEFVEVDEQARRVVIKASGKDSRGNGTASATVTLTLVEVGAETKGTVSTDLTITGKPAQFGRGMIAEVGGKILDSFAGCLAGKLGPAAAQEETPAAPAKGTSAAAKTPARTTTARATTRSRAVKDPAPADAPAKPAAAAKPVTAPTPPVTPAAPATPAAPVEKPALSVVNEPKSAEPESEPIDLLSYAGPSVAKRAVPAVVALVVVLLIIRRLRRR
jgi:carbon monoxide dehydrogenase subunit G